jgi:hypothetical protein
VKSLEEHADQAGGSPPPDSNLPSADDLVRDVEDFLRQQGGQ